MLVSEEGREAAIIHQSINMKLHHTLICFLFLSLQDGNTGLINAQTIIYTGTEGGDVTVKCSCYLFRSTTYFCKEPCEPQDVLIETTTTEVRAQKDRYSIELRRQRRTLIGNISVTIKQLSKSDSGLYRCGCVGSFQTSVKVEIVVVDEVLLKDSALRKTISKRTGENLGFACAFTLTGSRKYFCKDQCEPGDILVETNDDGAQRDRYSIRYIGSIESGTQLHVSITQLTKSDSGRYRCGLDRSSSLDPSQHFDLIVTDAQTTSTRLAVYSSSGASTTTAATPTHSSGSSTRSPTDSTGGLGLALNVTVAIIVIISFLAPTLICLLWITKPDGLDPSRNTGSTNMEAALYENCRPVAACEDSTYQSLDPAGRSQNQIYSTLTHT